MRVFFFFPAKRLEQNLKHAIQILQDIVVPESDDMKTFPLQKRRSRGISLLGVLTTVNFHDQGRFDAAEIGHIWPDGPLPPELMAAEASSTKPRPQDLLGVRRIAAQTRGMWTDCSAHDTHTRVDNKKKTLIPAFSRKREKEHPQRIQSLALSRLRGETIWGTVSRLGEGLLLLSRLQQPQRLRPRLIRHLGARQHPRDFLAPLPLVQRLHAGAGDEALMALFD